MLCCSLTERGVSVEKFKLFTMKLYEWIYSSMKRSHSGSVGSEGIQM